MMERTGKNSSFGQSESEGSLAFSIAELSNDKKHAPTIERCVGAFAFMAGVNGGIEWLF